MTTHRSEHSHKDIYFFILPFCLSLTSIRELFSNTASLHAARASGLTFKTADESKRPNSHSQSPQSNPVMLLLCVWNKLTSNYKGRQTRLSALWVCEQHMCVCKEAWPRGLVDAELVLTEPERTPCSRTHSDRWRPNTEQRRVEGENTIDALQTWQFYKSHTQYQVHAETPAWATRFLTDRQVVWAQRCWQNALAWDMKWCMY